jgi:hypothetical protein
MLQEELKLAQAANELEQFAIGIAPEGPEFADPRQGRATVVWTKPLTLDQAIIEGRGRPGTYILYKRENGRFLPLTNGISKNLGDRIAAHRTSAQRFSWDDFRVRLGIMPRFTFSRAMAVEHSVRREHDRTASGGERIKRRLTGYPKGPMRVGSGTFVEVTHRGKVPAVIRRKLHGQKIRYGPGLHEIVELPLTDRQLEARLASAAFELQSEAETAPAKRWHYVDAWWSTPSGGWEFLEKVGPVLETKAGGETLRSTLWFKWQGTATAQARTLLVRCLSHTGSQWVDCNSVWF